MTALNATAYLTNLWLPRVNYCHSLAMFWLLLLARFCQIAHIWLVLVCSGTWVYCGPNKWAGYIYKTPPYFSKERKQTYFFLSASFGLTSLVKCFRHCLFLCCHQLVSFSLSSRVIIHMAFTAQNININDNLFSILLQA